jgi:N-acetylglucosaminyldiphosphoundecaprenol N-acetyl-beta-D-mannosaminyltransferase
MSAVAGIAREPVATAAVSGRARGYRAGERAEGAIELLGICVHDVNATGVLGFMDAAIREDRQAVILHVNAFAANLGARHGWLREAFRDAQMVFCDGDGIRWACRMLRLPVPPKVTYARWLPLVAAWAEEHGHSLYFLGGRPGVAAQAARNFVERHPRLRIAGTHHGYFAKSGPESEAVVAGIGEARPDVLLVCFGMPVQEQWVVANAPQLSAHVVLTGGAALDYAAGIAVPTPPWMVRMELEWLFRLWMEPRRLFTRYVVGNPEFVARVLAEKARRTFSRQDAGRGAGTRGGA